MSPPRKVRSRVPQSVGSPDKSGDLAALLTEIRACRACLDELPYAPRPVVQAEASARLVLCGQAPGTKVQQSGIPFDDRSGERLRSWLGLDAEVFYDPARVAIVPMGFCYPGRHPRGGDLPPRPECAPLWHPRLIPLLDRVESIVLIGSYAQAWYLGARRKRTLGETVAAWREYAPRYWPLPHPSWRNDAWLKRHPWFERDVLPALRAEVERLVKSRPTTPPDPSSTRRSSRKRLSERRDGG